MLFLNLQVHALTKMFCTNEETTSAHPKLPKR